MKFKLKYQMVISLLMVTMLLVGAPNATVSAQDDHDMGHDDTHDQCDEATQEEKVVADPNDDGSNEFDVTSITAEPGTCLKIEFENGATSDEHSFAIEHQEGVMEKVHLHLMNSSMEHKSVNIQLPDEEVTIPYFCNVSDHADDGMVGQIVVESASALPGFGMTTALTALAAMLIAVPVLRRKFN